MQGYTIVFFLFRSEISESLGGRKEKKNPSCKQQWLALLLEILKYKCHFLEYRGEENITLRWCCAVCSVQCPLLVDAHARCLTFRAVVDSSNARAFLLVCRGPRWNKCLDGAYMSSLINNIFSHFFLLGLYFQDSLSISSIHKDSWVL